MEAVGCIVVSLGVAGLMVGRAAAVLPVAAADVVPAPLSAVADPSQPARPAMTTTQAAAASGFTYLSSLWILGRTEQLLRLVTAVRASRQPLPIGPQGLSV